MNSTERQETHGGGAGTYVAIWFVLLALTGVTVAVAGAYRGAFSTLTALAIASTKAGLVCWYFMHLKYEQRFFKLLFLVPIVTLAVIIGLTFTDIWYR